VETVVVTEVVEATPVEVIQVVTPTQEPVGPRTLVICMGAEPESLYPFGKQEDFGILVNNAFAESDWGAFDSNSYAYQPTILEKLPNLADGDATLATVRVSEGDSVVDASGEPVVLDASADPQIQLVPAAGGAPIIYQGGNLEMEQLSATFTMLPGILWSNGTPMTSADSVYAFNLLADPDTPRTKFTIARTSSYKAIDDLTTVWTGLPGFMDSSYYLNFFGPAPEHAWNTYTAAELLTAEISTRSPIGWGPYIIDEWKKGESMTLYKNPNYFRAKEGLPKFNTLIFRFIGDDAVENIAALLSGECDILDRTSDLETQNELLLDLQAAGQVTATFSTSSWWEHIDFGIQHSDYDDGFHLGTDRPDFFSDVRTRQAFALCMDRQAMVEVIWFGQSVVLDSYLPAQHPQYNAEVNHYGFDVQAGGALLNEVGWVDDDGDSATPRVAQGVTNVPDGTRLEITFETSRSAQRQNVVDILQASFAECGIKVVSQLYNPHDLFANGPEGPIFGRRFDLGGFAWATGVKPPCELFISSNIPGEAGDEWISILDAKSRTFGVDGWIAQNNSGFANEEYDIACNSALGSLPGKPEFEAAHLEAQRIFAEQLPVVPLYLYVKMAATRPDMCGFIMDPTANSEFWNIEEFDYGEGCEE
jgi:peptide/nickel transport system substrate-binding protein